MRETGGLRELPVERMDTDTEGLYELYLEMINDKDRRTRKKIGLLVIEYQEHLMNSGGM